MKKLIYTAIIPLLFLMTVPLSGFTMSYSISLYGGVMPGMGGNLNSLKQEDLFSTDTGIDGINRSSSGYSTSAIYRLLGVSGGLDFRAIFFDYLCLRLGANYNQSVWGGKGTTLYDDSGTLTEIKCKYSLMTIDAPLTAGLSIPFWKDVKITFGCGVAFGYGQYKNKFETAAFTYKGHFEGWTFPLVLILEGDYFLTNNIAIYTSLFYYNGSTGILKDKTTSDSSVDYASISFSGYRFSLGFSLFFYTK